MVLKATPPCPETAERRADRRSPTIDLRETVRSDADVVDLRDTNLVAAHDTTTVATATPSSSHPSPAHPSRPPQPVELLRFGPGVPAVIATAPAAGADREPAPRLGGCGANARSTWR